MVYHVTADFDASTGNVILKERGLTRYLFSKKARTSLIEESGRHSLENRTDYVGFYIVDFPRGVVPVFLNRMDAEAEGFVSRKKDYSPPSREIETY